jgi:uncharacterized protein
MASMQGFAPGRHVIEGYGRGGFRFAGMSHIGSILALPSGVHAWAIEGELAFGDFATVLAEREQFEYLLVGTGQRALSLTKPFALALRDAGLRFDIMDTPAALRTYNVLLAENRLVAGAFLAVA